jgi:hypothetical protein
LGRLEARLLPPTEERVLILDLVSADGEIVGTREFKLSTDRRPIKRNRLVAVKAIGRRLRRLEDQIKPRVNERGETLADVIRARRRRRLEAAGLPSEEPSRENFAGTRSRSEIIMRLARQRARERAALG